MQSCAIYRNGWLLGSLGLSLIRGENPGSEWLRLAGRRKVPLLIKFTLLFINQGIGAPCVLGNVLGAK